MLEEILKELDGHKFVTKEEARAFIANAWEIGRASGRLEEMQESRREIEELHKRLMERLNKITI
jgi:phage/plasmid primase-like uncharacterized protein